MPRTSFSDQLAENNNEYFGQMSSTASHRSFLDIEPNISVRTNYSRDDYYSFRPGEKPASHDQAVISECMKAYEKVGLIKNVIDLMGDFGSQGIHLVHEVESHQRFYRRWWELIQGTERSERFLNMLFRCGNVVIRRRNAKLNKANRKQLAKGDDEVDFPKIDVSRRSIPFVYDFLNPLTIEIVGGGVTNFESSKKYRLKLSSQVKRFYKQNPELIASLPAEIQKAINSGGKFIELNQENLRVFHYKKDDWQLWAHPMITAILDDITMLEKMKLADMSALDGAISNIRLWRLGDLDNKIVPTKTAINRLRDILASNVGGGTMDLVWGPELDFKESATQIYKFLGNEKYGPVYNSIYAGMGVPPTLTGISGQSGGYTNNFISLKTLIERLEYGRKILQSFWDEEIRRVQKAMGFSKPAKIHYDHMLLSDEAAEKNLLIQLADRNVISMETLRERFGEDDSIEESRIKRENTKMDNEKIPSKVSPYHASQPKHEYAKIALQKGEISIEDVTDLKARPEFSVVGPNQPQNKNPKDPGRPINSDDKVKRKEKTVRPKTKPGKADLFIWAIETQKEIAKYINPAILAHYNKKTLRQLSKEQSDELETIKFQLMTQLSPLQDISPELLLAKLNVPSPNFDIIKLRDLYISEHTTRCGSYPTMDDIKNLSAVAYVTYHENNTFGV